MGPVQGRELPQIVYFLLLFFGVHIFLEFKWNEKITSAGTSNLLLIFVPDAVLLLHKNAPVLLWLQVV